MSISSTCVWPLLVFILQQDLEARRAVCFPEGCGLQSSRHRTAVWHRAGHVLHRCRRVYLEPVPAKANLWLNRHQYLWVNQDCGSYATNCTFTKKKININQDGQVVERTTTSTLVKLLWVYPALPHFLYGLHAYLMGCSQCFALVGKDMSGGERLRRAYIF